MPKVPAEQETSLASPCTSNRGFRDVDGALRGHQRGDALGNSAADGAKSWQSLRRRDGRRRSAAGRAATAGGGDAGCSNLDIYSSGRHAYWHLRELPKPPRRPACTSGGGASGVWIVRCVRRAERDGLAAFTAMEWLALGSAKKLAYSSPMLGFVCGGW